MTTVQGQKVKGQGHKVTHKKFTQSRPLALVTLESNQWETLTLITQERIAVGASNLVGIIDVGSTRVVYFLGQ